MPSTSPTAPGYTWDERAGRYRASSGRWVSRAEIKTASLNVAKASGENIARLANGLRDGNLSLAEWQTGMMREIKLLHVAEAAAARGGWAQMSQADWGATGAMVKSQYKYLQNFAQEIANGKQPLNGRFNVRCGLYGKAGYSTYTSMQRRWQMIDNQMEEERRVINATESCGGCIKQASLSWQPIGTLDAIGEEECRSNCRCEFEYRRTGENGQFVYS